VFIFESLVKIIFFQTLNHNYGKHALPFHAFYFVFKYNPNFFEKIIVVALLLVFFFTNIIKITYLVSFSFILLCDHYKDAKTLKFLTFALQFYWNYIYLSIIFIYYFVIRWGLKVQFLISYSYLWFI